MCQTIVRPESTIYFKIYKQNIGNFELITRKYLVAYKFIKVLNSLTIENKYEYEENLTHFITIC